jgi:hypothetical protein
VPRTIPKPRPAKPGKTGAMLTSRMGDLLAGLTEEGTGVVEDDVARKDGNTSPAPKSRRGKKAAIEPSARTTRSKSQKPMDSTPRVTRASGNK